MYTTALQNGTEKDDIALEVAGGYDGLVVLTGTTQGNWGQANHGGNDSFAVILDSKYMVSESGRTVAPTASETSWLESFSSALGIASPTLLAAVLIPVVIVALLVCMGLAVVRHRRKVRGAKSSSIVPPNGSNSKHTEKAYNGK